jgi:Family of unknown function (DUF6199)
MVIEGSWVVLVVVALFVIVPIVMIVAGFCSMLWPRSMWFLSEGWKYKNAEPSGCALVATRIGGLFAIVFGSVFLLVVRGLFFRGQ